MSRTMPSLVVSEWPTFTGSVETLFSVHIRSRQLLRKLNRRDAEAFPVKAEFRFLPQEQRKTFGAYLAGNGDYLVSTLEGFVRSFPVIEITRGKDALHYTYLTPIYEVSDE